MPESLRMMLVHPKLFQAQMTMGIALAAGTIPPRERELAVLKLLAAGCSNKEIGAKLSITEGTVKNHMTNVLGKLGVLDRTQAALRAREMGLI